MCVPWELNPQHFVLLTQCSTTEPQEHWYHLIGQPQQFLYWYSECFSTFYCSLWCALRFITTKKHCSFVSHDHFLPETLKQAAFDNILLKLFKGIVNPKMKILSLITHELLITHYLLIHYFMSFQTHKTFVNLRNTNSYIFDEIRELSARN